jgi:hypothetical protein
MSFKTKVRKAFRAAKKDLVRTRRALSNAVFSLSNEYAKMTMRIRELEQRVDELEGKKYPADYKASYKAETY